MESKMSWSEAEDRMLLGLVEKYKESKATYELIARALNIAGKNGQISPFRTDRACKRRFRDLRRKSIK